MIESSEMVYTTARPMPEDTDASFFTDSFIHMHVPAGATPKDGPSAPSR